MERRVPALTTPSMHGIGHTEIVFIDTAIADYQALVDGIRAGVEVILIDGASDGLAQIAAALAGRAGIEAVHLFSHGAPGVLQLGATLLDDAGLAGRGAELAVLREALAPGADLLLYGCDVAAGLAGERFLHTLSAATGADVAASVDPSGSALLGGDWELESSTGAIAAESALTPAGQAGFGGLLGVASENFDGMQYTTVSGFTSMTLGAWTFTSDVPTELALYDSNTFPTPLNTDEPGNTADHAVALNDYFDPGAKQFAMKSTDGTNFSLGSVKIGQGPGMPSNVSIEAWSNGQLAVAGVSLDLSYSTYSSGITYSFAANGPSGQYGTLSFGSAYANIDEIRFVFASATTLYLDNITVGPAVDTTAPQVTGVWVPANGIYAAGRKLSFTVFFNEALTVTGTGSALGLDIGGVARSASFESAGSGSITYSYTLQAGEVDANGITVGALSLNGSTIRDAAGNNANLTLNGVGSTSGVLVDGIAPSVTGNIGVPAGGSYKAGDTLAFTVTLNENVTVTGSDSTLLLDIGGVARSAVFGSASSNTIIYRYTVQAGDMDSDGIGIAGIVRGNTTVRDAAGNDANLVLAGHLPPTTGIRIDTTAPTITAVEAPADGTYVAGDELIFTVRFSEDVVDANSLSTLGLAIGGAQRAATFLSATGDSISYRYIVQTGDSDIDGIAVTGVSLPGTSIRDGAGNDAILTLDGNLPALGGVLVDARAPAVAGLVDVPATGSYRSGQTLSFTLTFDEDVTVAGTDSTLGLTIGSTARSASFASATANSITYTYTVQAGDNDANGIAVTGVTLGTTTIRDAMGNDANLALAGHLPSTAGVLVDTTAPAVSGNVSVPANATYVAGQNLDFTVTFAENVSVSGSDSTLELTIGSVAKSAVFLSASGNTVTYRYIVQAGDVDADGIAIGALSLGGSTIRDAAGNDANLALAGHLPSLAGVLVDGTVPAVAGTVSAPADGVYSAGQQLAFTVVFDENVSVSNTASTLGLVVGGTARSAVFTSQTANSVTYTYTVQGGDKDADGIAITGIALNGSTIRDAAGNNASLSLAGHLPSLAGVLVDAGPPAVAGTIAVPAAGSYGAGQTLSFTVSFDEDVTVTGTDSTLGLTIGSTPRSATFASKTANSITYTYTVQAGDNDANGIAVGTISLGATTIRDAAGNDATLSLAGHVPPTSGVLVDTAAPAVSGNVSVPANATYIAGQNLDFTVTFDENVTVGGSDSTLALTVGSVAKSAVFLSASGNTVTYRYIVQPGDVDANGITIGAIALGSSTIRDAAGNDASLALAGHLPATGGVLVDGTVPGLTGMVSAPANGNYGVGQALEFTVTFDENVVVAGTASTLALDVGGAVRNAAYVSKTANSITYRYTVQAGDNDADGIAITGIALNGGTIRDAAGNDANLALAGHLPPLAGVRADTAGPVLATASVNGATMVLRYTDANALDAAHPPLAGSFAVTVAGSSVAVTSVAVDAAAGTVTLVLATAVGNGQAVTVAYTDPTAGNDGHAVQDALGNDAAGFGATAVTNATPAPSTPAPPTTSTTIDGVSVSSAIVVLGDGSLGQRITIPIVSPSRQEQVGGNTVADIPLVKAADGSTLLGVQVPTGAGLQATGATAPKAAGASLTDLIREIKAHTAAGSQVQDQLTGGGAGFLDSLSNDTPLLVQTIVVGGNGGNAGTPIGIIGQPQGAGAVQSALVIDTRSLSSGATIELHNVEFAAVIGAATVTGGAGSQHVWGDGASQTIFLGADDDVLHGGAGDDIVGSAGGNDMIYGDEGIDLVFGGEGDDYLDGGSGQDTARFAGRSDGYSLRLKDGKLVVTDRVGKDGVDTVVAVETLRFTGGQSMAIEAVLERLYEGLLHRQASHAEISFWQEMHGRGVSMHDIAAAMIGSPEGAPLHRAASDAAFVAGLYQSVLGRAAPQESSFWTGVLASGADRATVALAFVNSAEKLASAQDVDFNHSDVAVLVRMYHAMFGRAPDEDGLNFWLARHDDGMSLGAIADVFAASPETRARLPQDSDAAFIDLLYRTVLERAPTAGEMLELQGQLRDGVFDRGQVLLNVAESGDSIAIVGNISTDIALV